MDFILCSLERFFFWCWFFGVGLVMIRIFVRLVDIEYCIMSFELEKEKLIDIMSEIFWGWCSFGCEMKFFYFDFLYFLVGLFLEIG